MNATTDNDPPPPDRSGPWLLEAVPLFLRGLVIGVANIIPGVSGGTMALILGIYERILGAIGRIDRRTVHATLRLLIMRPQAGSRFLEEMRRIDALFLCLLGAGAVTGIFALARLMTYLLQSQHDPTYGFFFGLVLLSTVVPWRLMQRKTLVCWIAVAAAAALVVALDAGLSREQKVAHAENKIAMKLVKGDLADARAAGDVQKIEQLEKRLTELGVSDETSMWRLAAMALAGAIAISAMILPGVSGSFILLLMGYYFEILAAITRLDILTLGVFGLGLVAGMLLFTRLLNWLIAHYRDPTMGILLGLMLGSLWSIWPFKEHTLAGAGSRFEQVIYLSNIWPATLGLEVMITIGAATVGGAIVLFFLALERRN